MKKILLVGIVAVFCGCYKYRDEAYDTLISNPEIFETIKAKDLRVYRVSCADDGVKIIMRLSYEKENTLDKERGWK